MIIRYKLLPEKPDPVIDTESGYPVYSSHLSARQGAAQLYRGFLRSYLASGAWPLHELPLVSAASSSGACTQ